MIQLDLKDPRPIYEQIKEKIKALVINGVVKPNDRIPSVRELAQTLTINPNTIQKAYKDLEAEGIIYSVKGRGNFIAALDSAAIGSRRKELFSELTRITGELIYLQTDEQSVIDIIINIYKQKEEKK